MAPLVAYDNLSMLFASVSVRLTANVEIPRIRMSKSQEIETLINEEALLFAMYLRNEQRGWNPRIVNRE
jgi:hypothetical protein